MRCSVQEIVWQFWSTDRCSLWPQVQLNLSLSINNTPASLPPPVIELQTCPNYQMSLLAQHIPQILWYLYSWPPKGPCGILVMGNSYSQTIKYWIFQSPVNFPIPRLSIYPQQLQVNTIKFNTLFWSVLWSMDYWSLCTKLILCVNGCVCHI